MAISIEIFVGEESLAYMDLISKLRINIFQEYPYLYQGDLEYEKNYMSGYTKDKKAMIAIAKIDGEIVGVSTGIPLISDSEIVIDAKNVFSKQNINISDYYYYGEVIVLPEHRGKGIANALFSAQDKLITSWDFKHVCILTVTREEDHPLKPIDYRSPDNLWKKMGFFRNNLTVKYHWPTIQEDKTVIDKDNELEFWSKSF